MRKSSWPEVDRNAEKYPRDLSLKGSHLNKCTVFIINNMVCTWNLIFERKDQPQSVCTPGDSQHVLVKSLVQHLSNTGACVQRPLSSSDLTSARVQLFISSHCYLHVSRGLLSASYDLRHFELYRMSDGKGWVQKYAATIESISDILKWHFI